MTDKKIFTELTFERVVRYLQCRGVHLCEDMCSKEDGSISFNFLNDEYGNVDYFFNICFLEGDNKCGKQTVEFADVFDDGHYSYLIKRCECEDILDFVREFEELDYASSLTSQSEDFSYLYEEIPNIDSYYIDDVDFDDLHRRKYLNSSEDIYVREYGIELSDRRVEVLCDEPIQE